MSLYKTTSPILIRLYLILLSFCLLASLMITDGKYHQVLYITSCIVILMPFIYLAIKSEQKILFSNLIMGFSVLVFIFLLLFRTLRDVLPPPQILSKQIVGYSHYYGYPFFIDTFLFFIFLSYPVIVFFCMYLYKKCIKK